MKPAQEPAHARGGRRRRAAGGDPHSLSWGRPPGVAPVGAAKAAGPSVTAGRSRYWVKPGAKALGVNLWRSVCKRWTLPPRLAPQCLHPGEDAGLDEIDGLTVRRPNGPEIAPKALGRLHRGLRVSRRHPFAGRSPWHPQTKHPRRLRSRCQDHEEARSKTAERLSFHARAHLDLMVACCVGKALNYGPKASLPCRKTSRRRPVPWAPCPPPAPSAGQNCARSSRSPTRPSMRWSVAENFPAGFR